MGGTANSVRLSHIKVFTLPGRGRTRRLIKADKNSVKVLTVNESLCLNEEETIEYIFCHCLQILYIWRCLCDSVKNERKIINNLLEFFCKGRYTQGTLILLVGYNRGTNKVYLGRFALILRDHKCSLRSRGEQLEEKGDALLDIRARKRGDFVISWQDPDYARRVIKKVNQNDGRAFEAVPSNGKRPANGGTQVLFICSSFSGGRHLSSCLFRAPIPTSLRSTEQSLIGAVVN
ncbi:hypothetical protein Trydic_g1447 [Trypoxylus dichotomus]